MSSYAMPQPNANNDIPDIYEGPVPLSRAPTEPTPFPVDALGDVLRPAALAIHEMTQAPMAICGQSVLGVASLIAQTQADVLLPMQQRCPLSLYLVTVAESSERKTSVDRLAMEPIVQYSADLRIAYDADKLSHRNRMTAYQNARKSLETAIEKTTDKERIASLEADLNALGAEPTPPPLPIIDVQEPTIEGLTKLLSLGHGFAGLCSSEGGAFLTGHGMSADNQIKTAAHMSSLWDGRPTDRIRQGDELMTLHGRRFVLHLMMQPNISEKLFSNADLIRQGWLSRVLVTAPQTTAGTRLFRAPRPQAIADHRKYVGQMVRLLERPRPHAEGKVAELTPRALPMSTAAERVWIEFHDSIEVQLAPTADLAPIRGWAGKLLENVGRIAGVLTIVDNPAAEHISAAKMSDAVAIGVHYLTEAIRLFESSSVSSDLVLANQTLEWIRGRGGRIYLQQVMQYGPNRIRTAAEARKILGILTEHRWLHKLEHGAMIDGKQRKDVWKVAS